METLWNSAAQRQQHRKVKHHSNHADKRSFGAYCQAGCFSRIFSTCWVGCVLAAHELLQGWNGTEPRPPLLGDFGSVHLFHTREQPSQRGNAPPTTPPISPGVKAP